LKKSNFEKFPEIKIEGHNCTTGWSNISALLSSQIDAVNKEKTVIAIDCYHGV